MQKSHRFRYSTSVEILLQSTDYRGVWKKILNLPHDNLLNKLGGHGIGINIHGLLIL